MTDSRRSFSDDHIRRFLGIFCSATLVSLIRAGWVGWAASWLHASREKREQQMTTSELDQASERERQWSRRHSHLAMLQALPEQQRERLRAGN